MIYIYILLFFFYPYWWLYCRVLCFEISDVFGAARRVSLMASTGPIGSLAASHGAIGFLRGLWFLLWGGACMVGEALDLIQIPYEDLTNIYGACWPPGSFSL